MAREANTLEGLQGADQSKSFATESRRIEVQGSFWIRPVDRYGFLWCLSKHGEILRVSPYDSQALTWSVLGDGFGKSQFTIAEIRTQTSKMAEPFLLAASDKAIKGVNLLNKVVKEFYSARAGESIRSNISESYVTVEADEGSVYFLKVREGQIYLGVANYDNDKEFLLPETDVAGPLRVNSRIFAYSHKSLLTLQDGSMVPLIDFKAINFKPWVSPPQETYFSPPFGCNPSVVRSDMLYIPGERLGQVGLLFVSLKDSHVSSAFIPSPGESSFSQDEYSRPIIARPGEIIVYEETAPQTLFHDGQLSGRGQPYHLKPLTVGFAKTAGGVESLRFSDNVKVTDFSLIAIRNLIDVGFFNVAGTLLFAYQGAQDIGNVLRLVVWEL